MSKKTAVPDAWDEDWEEQADKAESLTEAPMLEKDVKVTKAEKLAKHAETNKKIWEAAEKPETFHYLAAHDNVPLKTEFKPTLKVLSRKPTPTVIKRFDLATGLQKVTLDDEEDEGEQKQAQPTPEELRLKALKDLEEKQKKYEEARARILGFSSGSSTPETLTPPTEEGRPTTRGKGRGRGGGNQESRRPDSQSGTKELFDPNYTSKAGVSIQKRQGDVSHSGRSTSREDDHIIRTPRGPDGSGGFGFASRSGKTS